MDNKVKEILIERIKKRGFPIAFLVGEADSDYGIIAYSESEFEYLGYAEDFLYSDDDKEKNKDDIKSLEDLSERDLLFLSKGTTNKKEIEEMKICE